VLWVAIAFAALSLLEALQSFLGGRSLVRGFREAARDPDPFAPPATLIVPFRGVDPGLEANLRAYFALDYPNVHILLVTDSGGDPSLPVLERVRASHPRVDARILVAGRATTRGQKVHNLLHALGHLRPQDRVVAFGDSDIRPDPRWLRSLIAPLSDPGVAVSTGFRWYLPPEGEMASVLRSVWNAGIVGLFGPNGAPFAWGGAMALRRETLDELAVRERWRGALSDDYAVSRAAREHGRGIRFEPRCLSFSHEPCTLGELLEWSRRQLAITRVYHPVLWRLGFVSELGNNLALWGGLAVLAASAAGGGPAGPAAALAGILGATYALRCAKARARLRVVTELFPAHQAALERHRLAYTFLGPITSLIMLSGLVRTAFSTVIEWRGMKYRMVSPLETEVLG
jgi:hypothetical protein